MDTIKFVANQLRTIADNIENGSCQMNKEEAYQLMKMFAHQSMSKQEACYELHLSRSKFDQMVQQGLLPKGQKRAGFKELLWYKDELYEYLNGNKG